MSRNPFNLYNVLCFLIDFLLHTLTFQISLLVVSVYLPLAHRFAFCSPSRTSNYLFSRWLFLISAKYRKTKPPPPFFFFFFHAQKNVSLSVKLFLLSPGHSKILLRAGRVNQRHILSLFTSYVTPYWLPSFFP